MYAEAEVDVEVEVNVDGEIYVKVAHAMRPFLV